jgi:hypothetical protein
MSEDIGKMPRGTVSVMYDPSPEAQEGIARMRADGWLVTVWGAPEGYVLPTLPQEDDAD